MIKFTVNSPCEAVSPVLRLECSAAEYAIPESAPSEDEARANIAAAWRARTTRISRLQPGFCRQRLRQHFFNVYAYCRISDDLGDEVGDTAPPCSFWIEWETELNACYDGHPRHPVFVALAETVKKFEIPKHEFADLLTAFPPGSDHRTLRDLRRSAGLLPLLGESGRSSWSCISAGIAIAERQQLSDYTCTALQLANFWQDVSADYAKGRIYLPLEDLRRFSVSEEEIRDDRNSAAFREMMRFEVERAREWFAQGLPLRG